MSLRAMNPPTMSSRRRLLAAGVGGALAVVAGPLRARDVPAEVAGALPAARLQGQARLRVFGLAVYDARLWVGERAVGENWEVPLALEIEYLRALVGARIAERSLEEMRRQGEIAPEAAERWLSEMARIFPDVRAGDRLTGIKVPRQLARFYANGRPCGEIRDGEFARRFFGIWLSPQTSEPALRRSLIDGGRS
jgi:hypothetical protein